VPSHQLEITVSRAVLKTLFRAFVGTAFLTASAWALALTVKPYSEAELASLQQAGKPVTVHFHAEWCPTCKNQAKSLEELKADPGLRDMTVLVADYDNVKDLRRSLKVRSQSTMVIYKGAQEVARVNGQTRAADIRAELVKAQ
jgi:thioredoxin 1